MTRAEQIKRALQLWAHLDPELFADKLRSEYGPIAPDDGLPRTKVVRETATRFRVVYLDREEAPSLS